MKGPGLVRSSSLKYRLSGPLDIASALTDLPIKPMEGWGWGCGGGSGDLGARPGDLGPGGWGPGGSGPGGLQDLGPTPALGLGAKVLGDPAWGLAAWWLQNDNHYYFHFYHYYF